MNQVRRNDDGSLKGKDDEVFERLSQAQSSAFDLIQTAATVRDPNQTAAVVPMLVIPDETLWCVEYDSEGNPSEPKQRDEVSFFLGQHIPLTNPLQAFLTFHLSHIEIVTFSALQTSLAKIMASIFSLPLSRPPS